MEKIKQSVLKHYQEIQTNEMLLNLLYWDLETIMPKMQINTSFELISQISSKHYNLITNSSFIENLKKLEQETSSKKIKKMAQKILKQHLLLTLYTNKEVIDIEKKCNISTQKWKQAREENDFNIFLPHLKNGITIKKDYIERLKKHWNFATNYDYLLNDFESNLSVLECDKFFNEIKNQIVPLYKKIISKQKEIKPLTFDFQTQDKLVQNIAKLVGFDFEKGVIAKSVHPFSSCLNPGKDVRMTYRFEENNSLDVISTILHESGHSLQSQLINEDLVKYGLATNQSLIVAESISRTYENYIGRNVDFIKSITNLINETCNFNYDYKTYYDLFNMVSKNSKIRVEADELTYPIHVLIRYEIEKEIFNGSLDICDIENVWNLKYKEYLNVDFDNSKEGILQDSHWSSWSFGYFPTYAMGSAYGVELFKQLNQEVDVSKCLKNLDFEKINNFYETKLFIHGGLYTRQELLKKITNKSEYTSSYINYLINKYE